MKKSLIFLTLIFFSNYSHKIDRVILAVDSNYEYSSFWPVVKNWWANLIGIKQVTLVYIGNKNLCSDFKNIIHFKPIPDVPTSFFARCVRLLIPAVYFPDEVCLISDIDIIPLNKDFFVKTIKDLPKDTFIIYHLYPQSEYRSKIRIPMCYIAGKGNIFSEMFNIHTRAEIPQLIKSWYSKKMGFITDEVMLFNYFENWKQENKNYKIFNFPDFYQRRILDRSLPYDINLIKENYYFDAHCPRPYLGKNIKRLQKLAFLQKMYK